MPVSLSTRVVCTFLQRTAKPKWVTPESGDAVLAAQKGPAEPPAVLAKRVTTREVDGFTVHRVEPKGGSRRPGAVVYLHGGAYVSQIVRQHWSLVADIADATGRVVEVPIYGLAPQHTGLQALHFGLAVLAQLDHEFGPDSRIDLAGDSAGGGLALLLARARRDAGLRPARRLVVMAPWLDISMANPEADEVEPYDPWLTRVGLHAVARAWAGELARTDPRVSPLYGQVHDLPPLDVFVGTRDITICDSTLFVDRIVAAGGAARLWVSPGSPHVHPLLPTAEGRQARKELIAQLCL